MTQEQAEHEVEKMRSILAEYFDAVQILVSRITPNGATEAIYRGSGNWYARQGMAHDFLGTEQAILNANAMKQ